MGLIFGLIKSLLKISVYLAIVAGFIVFIPNLPPYTKFSRIIPDLAQPRVGPLAPNEVLNKAEKLYLNKVLGPEAFQVYKGELFTSLATGEIVKLNPGGHVTFVTKLGQPCTGLSQEHICGRPLGFQIDEANDLMYVADAHLGIWKVNLKNDKKQLLVSPRVEIEGRSPKLINCLALAKNGDLYWSDSSSDFSLQNGAYTTLADPSGRLFHYNAAKNQSEVLLDSLWFANGVAISPDNQFVVVVETLRFRLVKYYIAGPKKGNSEVFVTGLPGAPDNIRVLPDGSGLLVGLYVTYDDENPLLSRSMAETPLIRKFLARLLRLVEIPFEYLNTVYPHVMFEDVVYQIGHFKNFANTLPKQSGLLVVDWNGKIVESYFNTDGTLPQISDAIVWNNKLITGGPHQNFIGSSSVPQLLKKAFGSKVDSVNKQLPVQEKQAKPAIVEKTPPRPAPKPAAAKPVEQPKPAAAKPVEQPKPAAAKPVEQPKPAAAKPVEQPKPAAAKPVEQPKPTAAKPVEQPKPAAAKPTELPKQAAAKPTEQPKPAASKPVQQPKPAAAKPIEQPKQTPPKPVEQPKKAEQRPTPVKQEPVNAPKQAKPTTKPEAQATGKPVKKSKESPKAKPDEPEPDFIVTRPKEEALNEMKNKLAPENIPIIEEIPSDTAKPNKETLKVIKKGGPAEIPNPHL